MKTNEQDLPQEAREFAQHYANERHAELLELDSNYQARIADAKWPEILEVYKQYCLERFEHHALALLPTSASTDAASINPLYSEYLDKIDENIREFLSTALKHLRPEMSGNVISWVNLKLSSRKLYWLAHAMRLHLKSHPAPVIDLQRIAELQARGNRSTADVLGDSSMVQPEAVADDTKVQDCGLSGAEVASLTAVVGSEQTSETVQLESAIAVGPTQKKERKKRPELPLRDRASAEAATELVREKARAAFPLLFLNGGEQRDRRSPRRDRLLYQLQEYSKSLFMCQARFCKSNAPDETTLRLWLKRIAPCVAKETIKETRVAFARPVSIEECKFAADSRGRV